jgi:hypothetical protein
MSLSETDRAEVTKALGDIDDHICEAVIILRKFGLDRIGTNLAATIASRLGVIDRLVRKP